MTEYRIICGNEYSELEHSVSLMMTEGWACQGGVATDDGGMYQAMIKEMPETKTEPNKDY